MELEKKLINVHKPVSKSSGAANKVIIAQELSKASEYQWRHPEGAKNPTYPRKQLPNLKNHRSKPTTPSNLPKTQKEDLQETSTKSCSQSISKNLCQKFELKASNFKNFKNQD